MKRRYWWLIVGGLLVLAVVGYGIIALYSRSQSNSIPPIRSWFNDHSVRPDLITIRNQQPCPGAPFILPSDGFIGLIWHDPVGPYNILNRHSGIDIFGDGQPGEIAIHAAYDGWLTRLADWRSTVIIRHDDPLEAGRVIWTYYTHMASEDGSESYIAADFPPDTHDMPVEQGTLIGYQGTFSGNPQNSVGLHVHFSIVLSESDGSFKNEARADNTLDPSPYLGMDVNIASLPDRPIGCQQS